MTLPDTRFHQQVKHRSCDTNSKMPTTARNVKFCPDNSNEIRMFVVADDILKDDLWFSADEFEKIKAESRADARQWRKMGYNKLLNDTFAIVASNHDGMMAKYDPQTFINAFCAFDGILNRRGLERFCSRKHGEERSDAKDRSRQVVIDAQKRLGLNDSKFIASQEDVWHEVSVVYAQSCREAKIFARRMGIGDEEAVTVVSNRVDQMEDILSLCRHKKMQRRLSNYSASTQSTAVSSFDSRIAPADYGKRIPPKIKSLAAHWKNTEDLYAAIA
jgi:hypothetical protein